MQSSHCCLVAFASRKASPRTAVAVHGRVLLNERHRRLLQRLQLMVIHIHCPKAGGDCRVPRRPPRPPQREAALPSEGGV